MSAAAKVVNPHGQFAPRVLEFTQWHWLQRRRRQFLAGLLFLLLVSLGSVWAVYTMQYYDELDLKGQQQNVPTANTLASAGVR